MKKLIQKWLGLAEPAKAALIFTFSSILIRGLSFFTTPIFTRIMDTTQYGIVTTYNSWQTVLEVFALLGMTSAGVFNVGLNDYRNERDQFISSVLILCNFVTVIVFSVIFAIKYFFISDFILPYSLLLIMFLYFIFSPALIFWMTRQRYEYKYKLVTVISIASSIVSQGVAVLWVVFGDPQDAAVNKVYATVLASMLFAIPIYFLLLKRGKTFYKTDIWKPVLAFAIPLLPHYMAQHVMASADRIMISDMSSVSDTAIYGVVSAISMVSTIIWGAINTSLNPYIFDKMNDKKYKDINGVVLPIIICYAILCIGVALIAPEVLAIMAPSEYHNGIFAVPPIAGVAFLSAFYNIYATIEFYHKKANSIASATIVACIVNILLNALLIPKYGFIAAAYTTLISNVVLIIMHYIGYRKCQPDRVYNDKWFVFVALLSILACELCNLAYLNDYVRYAIIVVILVVTFVKRNYIIDKYRTLKS